MKVIKFGCFFFLLLISSGIYAQDININENGVKIDFQLFNGKHLRELIFYPENFTYDKDLTSNSETINLEVSVHTTGDSYSGIKLIDCQPASRLEFIDREETKTINGKKLIFTQFDPMLKLKVQSVYEFFNGTSTIRCYTRLINESKKSIGLEHVSSAMINNFGNLGKGTIDEKLVIHNAHHSWDAEGQWKMYKPADLGWTENGKYHRAGIFKSTLGSWSTITDLPFAMVENKAVGLTWFWQIEHNGSWH